MARRFVNVVGSPSFLQLASILGVATALGCGGGDGGGSGSGGGGESGSGGGAGFGGSGGYGGSAGNAGTATNGGASGSGTGGSASSTNSTNSGGTAGSSTGGDGGTGGLAYPLWLTPLGNPSAETAHVGLYFTVTDALQQPVASLVTEDFVVRENGTSVDPFESAFRVGHPAGQLVIPTVLVLDLSRSVVEAGALDEVKDAAKAIIDSLDPAQELAILTFAGDVTQRSNFTRDKLTLHAAIDDITDADGISTNLYGALQQGYGLWSDGFYDYQDDAGAPQLVAGLLIAVSDGNDTSGVSTLDQVIGTRGTKRTIFIRVGDDLDQSVASQIANAGLIDAVGGFEGLAGAVEEVTQRVASLNDAIYVAEYCSPKRANSHDLFFTVSGNEDYVSNPTEALCDPSGPGPSCDGSDYYCGPDHSGEFAYLCCDPEFPFMCATGCYRTQEDAYAECGSGCIECGAASEEGDGIGQAVTSIEIQFDAGGFSDDQCAELFEPGTGGSGSGGSGSGGSGSGGTGSGGAGGSSGAGGTGSGGSGGGPAVPTCSQLREAAFDFCQPPLFAMEDFVVQCGPPVQLSDDCGAEEYYGCEPQRDIYWSCLADDIAYGGDWQCQPSPPSIACLAGVCDYEMYQLASCMAAR